MSEIQHTQNIPQTLGLIGFGEVGHEISRAYENGFLPGYRLVALLTRNKPKTTIPEDARWLPDLNDFLKAGLNVVVEAASADAVKVYANTILRTGPDLITLSAAAFADSVFEAEIHETLVTSPGRLIIPSGAIGGLDAVSSAMTGGVKRVVLTQRKPPTSLLPAEEARQIRSSKLLSEGTAREAALKFPKNANIAAALGIAGPGMDNVIVRVVADPRVSRNTAELNVEGEFGCMRVVLENEPSRNMRTSRLTSMAIIATLVRRTAKLICPA